MRLVTTTGHWGLQAMQLLPCHAGLVGLRLLDASRFSAMRLSLSPFGSGKAAHLKEILHILSRLSGRQYALLRRTASYEQTLFPVSSMPWFGMVWATMAALPLSEPRMSTPTVFEACYSTSCMGRIRGRGKGRPAETKC